MCGSLGVDIGDDDGLIGLKQRFRGNLARDDLAKEAVGITWVISHASHSFSEDDMSVSPFIIKDK
jgi:hypothetical protein